MLVSKQYRVLHLVRMFVIERVDMVAWLIAEVSRVKEQCQTRNGV